MSTAYETTAFTASREMFESLVRELESAEAQGLTHAEVESLIDGRGTEVLRILFQDHLTLRSVKEARLDGVLGSDKVLRTHVRPTKRGLTTVFGEVEAMRLAYGARDTHSVCPMDAELNLPRKKYSDGVRRLVAEEAARGSYEETVKAMGRATAAKVPKRQAEELAAEAAQDFDAFYAERTTAKPERTNDLLVLTTDGKGIVMRKEALREETRKVARRRERERDLNDRDPQTGKERTGRRRMATVASVYSVPVHIRSAKDVMSKLHGGGPTPPSDKKADRPKATNKRVWASITKPGEDVIEDIFAEALRRDPDRKRKWVVLVDGNVTQIERIEAVAKRHSVEIVLVLDIIHVVQYLWRAANAFHRPQSPEAREWVCERLLRILEGHSSNVAAGIRRSATLQNLRGQRRKAADTCANYLLNYRDMLRYDEFLAAGLPIATGVIEGACRHLIKDRLDITGARWGLAGAEAILRLRSIRSSGDFDEYWTFHQQKQLQRNHLHKFAESPLKKAG